MALLDIRRLNKSFGSRPVLHDIDLSIAAGEIVCLLGPSGSGKTTLLRLIAGLERADEGVITFDGRDLAPVAVHERGFGLMFQDLALFPHRDVFDNVAFGLRMANQPRAAVETRVRESLALVGLGAFAKRDVNLLSGGEQQRVALARALAPRPRLLMFDEPLGALDRLLREQLIVDIRAILKQTATTAVYVTHDQAEAMAISDRIAILNDGRVAQFGTPEELYHHPADEFVARFLDLGTVVRGDWLAALPGARSDSDPARWYLIRPEQARLADDGVPGVVRHCRFESGAFRLTVDVNGQAVRCESQQRIAEGSLVRLRCDAEPIS
ncbi:MAG: ABC transporter ATP-binding protein [Chloroflexi bacterium]|nr:ABC transporter ATP-binding protein [Chloroflexota bacterium]